MGEKSIQYQACKSEFCNRADTAEKIFLKALRQWKGNDLMFSLVIGRSPRPLEGVSSEKQHLGGEEMV